MTRAHVALCAALLLGCGRSGDPPITGGGVFLRGSSGRATIDYQPNVKRAKRDAGLAAIRGISKEGSTLLLDGTAPELRSLRPGDVLLSRAVSNAVASNAASYVELVTSTGMSHTGMSAIAPCTRHDMHLIVKVGASAQAFGQQIGKVGTEIFKRHVVRIDPPGTRLCEQVGSGASAGGEG